MKKAKLIVTILTGVSLIVTAIVLVAIGFKIFSTDVDLVVYGTGTTSAAAAADAVEKALEQIMPMAVAAALLGCGIALLVFGILLVTGLIDSITKQVKNKKVIKIISIIIVASCLVDVLSASTLMKSELPLKIPALILLILSLGLLITSLALKVKPVYTQTIEPAASEDEQEQ